MLFLWQDIRYGFRGLRANSRVHPFWRFSTLALGIGAATTMFSVIQNA